MDWRHDWMVRDTTFGLVIGSTCHDHFDVVDDCFLAAGRRVDCLPVETRDDRAEASAGLLLRLNPPPQNLGPGCFIDDTVGLDAFNSGLPLTTSWKLFRDLLI